MSDCSLYLVSPPAITLAPFLIDLETALSQGIVKAFQLRLKQAEDSLIIEASQHIAPICAKYEVAFILNDRADLVDSCHADGVHLGQEDMDPKVARAILGKERVIGVSCHASLDMGFDACEKTADYVAFGAFFPTTSKPAEKIAKWGTPTSEIIDIWSTNTSIPCVAIGGMTAENCGELVRVGADFIGVINAVWQNPLGVEKAVGAFKAVLAG